MKLFHKVEPGYFTLDHSIAEKISYPDAGNANCYAIEEGSQWFQARNRYIEQVMRRFPFSGDFIDIGGGNGYQLNFFQKNIFKQKAIKSAMCEPGVQGCTNAAQRGVDNVYCCTFDDFPVENFNIGGVGLFDVIEHIEDDGAFLQNIIKKVPSGTLIYITVPALNFLWSAEDISAGHFRRYNLKEQIRLLRATNLKLIFSSYFFSYYVPFVYFFRVISEKFRIKYAPEVLLEREQRYHNSSGKIKWVLDLFHSFEISISAIGIKPPLGTSRMLVLKKQ